MKKMLGLIILLGLMATGQHAFCWTVISQAGSNGMNITSDVAISSITTAAKLIIPSNANRKSYAVQSNEYTVRISTFATTSWSGIIVSTGTEWRQSSGQAYTGDIYAIGLSTNATVNTWENYLTSY